MHSIQPRNSGNASTLVALRLLVTLMLLAAALAGFPGALLGEEVVPTSDETIAMARAQEGERWYGVYVLGKKVGWQRDAWKEKRKGEKAQVCVESEFTLKMAFLARVTTISSRENVCYNAKPPFKLASFSSVRNENGRIVTITGTLDREEIVYTIDTGDNRRESRAPEEWNRLEHNVPWAALARMKPGDYTKSLHYDELTNRKKWMKVWLVSREKKNLMGRSQEICKVLIEDESGMKLDSLITSGGIILEGSLGPSVRIVLEDKKTAINSDVQFLDLYSTSFIPAEGHLDDTRVSRIRKLKLKLIGNKKLDIPETPRQRILVRGDNFIVIESTSCPQSWSDKAPPSAYGKPREAGEGENAKLDHHPKGEGIELPPQPKNGGIEPPPRALECTADIPCDIPEFRMLAQKETFPASNTMEKARLLSSWVHRNFRYRLGGGGGTGDVILRERSGDCTEFSKGLVTLLRAAGIPARILSGIVVASASPLSFGYHAWVDAWVDGAWVNLDPTWGYFPVDASHVVFDLDEGLQMASHLGGLKIEILEVEYQEDGDLRCDSVPTYQQQVE